MKKVISFALWGKNPKYTVGAIANAQLAKSLYPGWITRFYCALDVPKEIISALENHSAEIIQMSRPPDARGMFWRFEVFSDPDVERAIMRDTDSRLSEREASAVREWVKSGKEGHIMRDHPYHSRLMMGGMWGAQSTHLRDISTAISQFNPADAYDQDQQFLAEFIYPRLSKHGILVHDSFFQYETESRPFPTERNNYEFIGEVIDEVNHRGEEWRKIADIEQNWLARVIFNMKRLLKKTQFWLGKRHL